MNFTREWMQRFAGIAGQWLGRVQRRMSLIAGATVGAVLVLVGLSFSDQLPRRQTYGEIWVDSPEVYTRERLVNDRFVQEAWLTAQLPKATRIELPGMPASSEVRNQSSWRSLGTSSGLSDGSKTQGAGQGSASDAADPTKRQGSEGSPQAVPPAAPDPATPRSAMRLSWQESLAEYLDFSEYVRNLLVENQLDDRHDLLGNSLYKLKFDVTVLPGENTQATAQIVVRLSPQLPAPRDSTQESMPSEPLPVAFGGEGLVRTKDELNGWRTVYERWVKSLEYRLNATHAELRRTFENEQFSHNDYARLIEHTRRLLASSERVPLPRPICRAEFEARQGESGTGRLAVHDAHRERKDCLTALVKAINAAQVRSYNLQRSKATRETGGKPRAADQYQVQEMAVETEPIDHRYIDPLAPSPEPEDQLLNLVLNAFFAPKTFQLALGIPLPESAFAPNVGQYRLGAQSRSVDINVPELESLINLTFIYPKLDSIVGKTFEVRPRTWIVSAIASKAKSLSDVAFENLVASKPGRFGKATITDFVELPGGILAYKPDLVGPVSADYKIETSDFNALKETAHIFDAIAEVGLRNFIRRVGKLTRTYVYAVAPKTRADTIDLHQRDQSEAHLSSDALVARPQERSGARAYLGLGSKTSSEARVARGIVVGHGRPTHDLDASEFGWVVRPRYPSHQGGRVYVQTAAQYSLSALVSMPSWWTEVRLEVSSGWLDSTGKLLPKSEKRVDVVHLPPDFESLEASLFSVHQLGPELMESQLDPVDLIACSPGSIVIPGRRLWRSTVVTLGSQRADEISVLPNMKGIVARFKEVEVQVGQLNSSVVPKPVRVWTSQGMVTLPTPAQIRVPGNCKTGSPVQP
jgi:hypothetical protein